MSMSMDVAALSTALNQIDTSTVLGVTLLSKSLDAQKSMGAEMIKMMEQSVQPNLGINVDVRV